MISKALNPKQYRRLGLWSAAFLTACTGVINVLSAVAPRLLDRMVWLRAISPFDVKSSAHFFSVMSGFFLLMLAANLLRRKRVAWLLTIGLLIISIVLNFVRGWYYVEGLFTIVLLSQLILMRNIFTASSDPPSIGQGIRVLLGALVFTLLYGTVGFYLQRHSFNSRFSLWGAMLQTVAMFFTDDNAGLVATSRWGRFFESSIYLVGAVTLTYAFFMILRPVLLRGKPASKVECQRAAELVEHYGCSSLARFTLFEDKAYYFSPSGQTMIAYVPKGRGAIALGDPIGPESDFKEAIWGFQAFCDRNDWHPGFYQVLPDHLSLYRSLGFNTLKIGEEGVVDLTAFTMSGKAKQDLRTSLNKFKRLGYSLERLEPPISLTVLSELRTISDEWLIEMQGAEKRFSLGWFDEAYIGHCDVFLVKDEAQQIIAFANVVNPYQSKNATVDLMRRRTEAPPGTMDFLFTGMFEHYKAQGYAGFNIGLSALSGVGDVDNARRLEKGARYLYRHLNRFYNFKGLHAYKDKFQPRWESRYLVYPSVMALPDVVMALIRADSGDRLFDYLRPDD
jgi:phosphatidylglycerol lysyltransferase